MKKVLITGGAGFIGSHLADELLRHGYGVRVFDNLAPQVHGPERSRPYYLDSDIELIAGDIRDAASLQKALKGMDAVFHLAAMVGVGQSMYEVAEYTAVNNTGTAILLQTLLERPVERLIVSSSMSLYGEGLYRAPDGSLVSGAARTLPQLKAKAWELKGPSEGVLTPLATPET